MRADTKKRKNATQMQGRKLPEKRQRHQVLSRDVNVGRIGSLYSEGEVG